MNDPQTQLRETIDNFLRDISQINTGTAALMADREHAADLIERMTRCVVQLEQTTKGKVIDNANGTVDGCAVQPVDVATPGTAHLLPFCSVESISVAEEYEDDQLNQTEIELFEICREHEQRIKILYNRLRLDLGSPDGLTRETLKRAGLLRLPEGW